MINILLHIIKTIIEQSGPLETFIFTQEAKDSFVRHPLM